ncbi:hypothetical protein KL86APRO_10856 [uncultured Alphaproteobacteria bacterium]|uniref:Uncharacterized protein n=1 Tax=uncultured Alphaproteobacteria bacterium TaxID=91750 RepID=A0A212JCM0_9PROT|nr:hypothetical protein KL86APRO_10856 [uncultured Alphaproteobacteria bacterium]
MQTRRANLMPDRMRPAWWWGGTQLWEFATDGEVRLYLPWGPGFGCRRWIGATWVEDAPTTPMFDRRGTWLDPEGPHDDAWQASCLARAAYFSGIPWALRVAAAREDVPWLYLRAAASQLFG